MFISILSALTAALGFLEKLWGWMSQKQLIEAGKSEQEAASLQKQVEATHAANKVREEAHSKWVTSTDTERLSDDGFSRD